MTRRKHKSSEEKIRSGIPGPTPVDTISYTPKKMSITSGEVEFRASPDKKYEVAKIKNKGVTPGLFLYISDLFLNKSEKSKEEKRGEESKTSVIENDTEEKEVKRISEASFSSVIESETKSKEKEEKKQEKNEPKPNGMLKFGKNVTKSSPDHNIVLEEILATNFARILGLPTSDLEFVLVETSKEQIKISKEKLEKNPSSKTEVFPALLSRFRPNASDFTVAVAGNHPAYNQGHTKPIGEGKNSNQIVVGNDYALLNILAFLTNDPDIMGKDGQNKMILSNGRLFSIDTSLHSTRYKPGTNITIRKDGRLDSAFFDSRISRDLTYLDEVDPIRHVSFRNCSITNDVSFSESFNAIKDFFQTGKNKLIMAEFKKAREKILNTDFPQKAAYLQKIDLLKRDVEKRIHDLYQTFSPYWELYYKITGQNICATDSKKEGYEAKEKEFNDRVQSLTALEELLSPSTMYSPEGIPLRAPEIPYEKHFFWHQQTGIIFRDPNVSFDEENQTVTIRLNNVDREAAERFRILFNLPKGYRQQFTCSIDEFKKMVTADRVRFITHPETISLKSVINSKLEPVNALSYMRGMNGLLKELSSYDRSLAISVLTDYSRYVKVDAKPGYNALVNSKLTDLENIYQKINKKLPKNLLSTSHPHHDRGWGKMVEIQAKVQKQQQYILYRLIATTPGLKDTPLAENILDIFEKADKLDITHSVNLLMMALYKNPELHKNLEFIRLITVIEQTPLIGKNKYEEISKNAAELRLKINHFLNNIPAIENIKQTESKETKTISPTLPKRTHSDIGLPNTDNNAKGDLSTSIGALKKSGLTSQAPSHKSLPAAEIRNDRTGLTS